MIGERQAIAILERALSLSPAGQTEALLLAHDSALTRFANSAIHQNVAERDAELRVRAVFGKPRGVGGHGTARIGVATTNNLSDTSIQKAVESACNIARLQAENPDFCSLPEPRPIASPSGFVERTASFSAEERAAAVAVICRKSVEKGLTAAGAFSTDSSEIAVANSLGVRAYYPSTRAELNTVIMSGSSSGYADYISKDVGEINAEALGDEAIAKAERGQNPILLEPGEYETVLEEYAVFDLLEYLGYLGFSGLAVQEGRSFMKLGQKIVGENISIWDDGYDPSGLPLPFDFEGVPKYRVDLIKAGVANAVVYDSYTATREGKSSTGHALPAPNTQGPFPLNMFMQPGNSTKEEMVKSTKRGILVTRFWYTRPVDDLKVIVTGTTRDGTFLIEDGEVKQPVRNLRFTTSYLDALSNTLAIGKATKLESSGFGASRVPAIKVAKFNFTGVTQY